jgi:hypothetical protein
MNPDITAAYLRSTVEYVCAAIYIGCPLLILWGLS